MVVSFNLPQLTGELMWIESNLRWICQRVRPGLSMMLSDGIHGDPWGVTSHGRKPPAIDNARSSTTKTWALRRAVCGIQMRIQLVQVVVATHNAPPDHGDHGNATAMAGSRGANKQHESPTYESHIGSWSGWNHIKFENLQQKTHRAVNIQCGWLRGNLQESEFEAWDHRVFFWPPKYSNAKRILYEWERIRLLELWSFGYGSIPIHSMFWRMNIQ